MALHRGEQILTTVETLLSTGLTFSSNVYRNRILNLQESDLPAVKLAAGPENLLRDYGNGQQDWALPIDFTCAVASLNDDLETLLFAYRKELHVAMRTDYTLGLSFVIDSNEVQTSPIVLSQPDGHKPMAEQDWRWEIHYRRSINDPSA